MTTIKFTLAKIDDLCSIIALLADDAAGSKREKVSDPVLEAYQSAFNEIQNDPNAHIVVAENKDRLIGVAQINFIRNLTYQGGVRAQIEGVRIRSDYRSRGIGEQFFNHLIAMAKENGCHLVQLTTDKSRPRAHNFYQKLGFVDSHAGFKLHLMSEDS